MELRRSVLVPYTAEGMFDLIEKAEAYPQFLPWCTSATILERSEEWVAARLEFSYLRVRFGFATRNAKRRPEWLQVRLLEGPFKRFQGDWSLTPLGEMGCKVNFALSYEISDGLLDRMALPAVDHVSRSMMDAFLKRAEETLTPCSAQVSAPPPAPLPAPPPAAPPASPLVFAPVAAPVPPPAAPDVPVPAASASLATPAEPPTTPIASEPTMSNLSHPTVFEALRASRLAEQLSAEQTAVLAGLVTLEDFAPQTLLAPEGQPDSRLYVVVAGTLAVVKHRGTPDETLLATLAAGDFAHELGFLDGADRYASLVAGTAAQVLVLERQKLESLIDTHPMILYRVMCAIVRTVHRVQTRLSIQAAELMNYVFKQHGRY